jgi:hypothetical protein
MKSINPEILIFRIFTKNARIFLTLWFITFPFITFSQDNLLTQNWGYNTAFLIERGKWETGIFQPFRLGLNDKLELRSNLFILPLLPNAGIKISYHQINGFQFASEHSVSYPTLFLDLVSFKGTGGMISPQYNFDFILSLANSIIVSKPIGSSSLFSADAGLAFAIRETKPDYHATIDLPLFYPRMAHYYDGVSIKAGVSYKGTFSKSFYFEENLRMFLITRDSENFFIENFGTVLWKTKGSFRLKGGYVLSWGKYPFGNHIQLWPVIDIIFGSSERK